MNPPPMDRIHPFPSFATLRFDTHSIRTKSTESLLAWNEAWNEHAFFIRNVQFEYTHTHTHIYALILQNYLKKVGAALRASNLLNLLLFGQVTRHREVVEYILIFHFLWIYSAYRVLPRCLANDDDVPSSFFLDDSSRTGPTGQRLHESVIHNLGVRAIWITATVKKGKGKVSPKSFLRRD